MRTCACAALYNSLSKRATGIALRCLRNAADAMNRLDCCVDGCGVVQGLRVVIGCAHACAVIVNLHS